LFDVGFWELAVIGLVALLVIGPERLPAVARTAGLWVGRLRRVAGSFREDLERELRTDDLKRSLVAERDALAAPIREVADELRSTVNDAAAEVDCVTTDAQEADPVGTRATGTAPESRPAPPNE
jgi:sec-independent protein translocase protein TatB